MLDHRNKCSLRIDNKKTNRNQNYTLKKNIKQKKKMNEFDMENEVETVKRQVNNLKEEVKFYQERVAMLNVYLESKDLELKAKNQAMVCLNQNVKSLEKRLEQVNKDRETCISDIKYRLVTRLENENAKLKIENDLLKKQLFEKEPNQFNYEETVLQRIKQEIDINDFLVNDQELSQSVGSQMGENEEAEQEPSNQTPSQKTNRNETIKTFWSDLDTNLVKYGVDMIDVGSHNRLEMVAKEADFKGMQLSAFDKLSIIKIIKFDTQEDVPLNFVSFYLQHKICTKHYGSSGFALRKKESSLTKHSIRFAFYCRNFHNGCKNKMYASYFITNKALFVSWTGTKCDCKK